MEATIELEEDGMEKYINKQIQEAMTRLEASDPKLAQFLQSQK